MIEYSCFVRKGRGPKCKICDKALKKDDPYCKMRINRFANPYFHAECLIGAGEMAKAQVAELEKIREKYESSEKIRKEKLKESQDPILFRKQVVRDALKSVDVNTQSMPISRVGNSFMRLHNKSQGIDCVLRIMNSVEIAFMTEGLMQIDTCPPDALLYTPIISWCYTNDKPKEVPATEIHLADPESIEKLGKAILSHDYRGHIKSRQKDVE